MCDNTAGRRTSPKTIVCDFSFAIINAILLSFNRCSLKAYLEVTWTAVSNDRATSYTTLKLCSAHFMKAASHRMYRYPCQFCVTYLHYTVLNVQRSLNEAE